MSDHAQCYLFSEIFEFLAKIDDDTAKKTAAFIWEKSGDYDFAIDNMRCDEALVTLGLARMASAARIKELGKEAEFNMEEDDLQAIYAPPNNYYDIWDDLPDQETKNKK